MRKNALTLAPARYISTASPIASAAALLLALGACTVPGTNIGENSSESIQQEKSNTASGEPAIAQQSPPAKTTLVGQQESLDTTVLASARVGTEDTFAVLGTNAAHKDDKSTKEIILVASGKKSHSIPVDSSCNNINTTARGVALSCSGSVTEYDSSGTELRTITVEGTAHTATITSTGDAVVGIEGTSKAQFFNKQGEKTESKVVTRSIDDILLIRTSQEEERAAIIDRGQTSITDITPQTSDVTAALRIGQGVGSASTGNLNGKPIDSIIVASDNKQNQVLFYSMNEVIRLHQSTPVGASPWATAWDSQKKIAWISTTGDNKLTAFRISSGTPQQIAQIDSIANVRGIFTENDGSLNVISQDGSLQRIATTELGI